MARLSQSELAGLLAFVRRIDACPSLPAFQRESLRALRELVPSDSASYNPVHPTDRMTALVDPVDFPAPNLDAFERNAHQHPSLRWHRDNGGGAVKLSDFLSRRELHSLALYHDFFRPLDIEHQLVVSISAPGGTVIGFPVHRRLGDFSESERLLLNLARRHLLQAHRRAEARTQAARLRELIDAPAGPGLIVLTTSGRIQLMTEPARRRLRDYFGGERLPEAIAPWLSEQRGRLDDGDRPPPPARDLVVDGPRGTLRLRHLAGARDRGEPEALLLEEERRAPLPAELRGLGLTARESEVLAQAAAGRTDAQIAVELGISPRTVDKHLERVYRKLGVSTRTAAVARAFTATA